MTTIFVIVALFVFAAYRWGRRIWPVAKKVGSIGDELGGWTLFFVAGGATAAKRGVTTGAKVLLAVFAVVVALFSTTVRLAVAGYVAWRLWQLWRHATSARAQLQRSGFAGAAERDLVAHATRQAMIAMNLGARQRTRDGDETVAPHCWAWRRLPILVGGKPVKGAYRYECRVEPAPGKGVPSLMAAAGRGLDADEDPLRDAINSALRSARGSKAKKAKAELGGRLPQFTLTTVEQRTVRGEKVGVAKLTLWSTDPFRRPVKYPYDPARPVITSFTDPVPVGLKRSNAEATMLLARHTSVQGINGSGKSSVVRPALLAAAHTDALIGVMAMKGPHDYQDLAGRFIGGKVIVDKRAVMGVLRWANQEIQRRNGLSAEDRAALPHLLLILDEGQELDDDIDLIVPIVKKGRAAKVWLWSVTQYGLSSIIPSEAAREMGQRFAGRIEGGVTQSQVAVGSRASKTAGPHLIPEDPRWVGVLFGSDGDYLRVYWVTAESLPGEGKSALARCAAALPARPGDPDGYLAAAGAGPFELAPIHVDPVDDGTTRIASGEATSIDFRSGSALPADIRAAAETVWAAAGLRSPSTRTHVPKIRQVLDKAHATVPDAVEQLAAFLSIPIPTTV